MKLSPQLLLLLNKTYEPSTLIETVSKGMTLLLKLMEKESRYCFL